MGQDEIRRFARPYDWAAMDSVIRDPGCIIAEGLFSEDETAELNREIDDYLDAHPGAGLPATGSTSYDKFLGRRTVRLQGLIGKLPCVASWIGHPEIFAWVERYLEPIATSALMNTAEVIQVGPGERAQRFHRDSDSWPAVPIGEHPIQVGALVALDPCTLENGATRVVLESWRWDKARQPQPEDFRRATLAPGDALLMRGDIWHGAGANHSDRPRRILGLTYIAGWLRPYENSLLEVSKERARELEPHVRQLLGLATYDGVPLGGSVLGNYNYGDPAAWLED